MIYNLYACTENCCLLVLLLLVALKSRFRRRRRTFRMTRRLTVSTWARTKACLTEPFDHTAPIYMIVAGRAWLGWLLYYYLHCQLIDVSCLVRILLFVYALTWVCICYMIFTWLLNAWVIWLIMEYFDDGYGWGRVSTTVGVCLRSSAIMVIDLSRRDCWELRTMVVLISHLTLVRTTTRPCMGRA
jgi:hypothetical protein